MSDEQWDQQTERRQNPHIYQFPQSWWLKLVAAILVPFVMSAIPLMSWSFKIGSDIEVIKNQIAAQMDDRYRHSQAVSDFALRDSQIRNLRSRCDKYETRLNHYDKKE